MLKARAEYPELALVDDEYEVTIYQLEMVEFFEIKSRLFKL